MIVDYYLQNDTLLKLLITIHSNENQKGHSDLVMCHDSLRQLYGQTTNDRFSYYTSLVDCPSPKNDGLFEQITNDTPRTNPQTNR